VTGSARDLAARARDEASEARDGSAGARDDAAVLFGGQFGHSAQRAARARVWAAADRVHAAEDRAIAALDREHAARELERMRADLKRAQFDGLTGAYQREPGERELTNEIVRARRTGGGLVLAFVDVDGLKLRNDHEGHAAGDALLRSVVVAIRSHLRSYDPIVRMGGDEFVCGLSNAGLDDARRRFDEISAALQAADRAASISVGLVEPGPHDTLQELTARGDAALYRAKDETHARAAAA
jgi:diguanylate cyclase (GGDEF)-like protein